ncbi:Protein of Unknown function [Arenibacter palladensis]|uniref:DUF2784 domain-containing protein n=1 Tax=Arenibacter palladensis TaxID=237373 RepID=A0A1M4Z314_9FLAO|nr:DUF2784 family protein [Arenibacter palladensis]SHF12449.1 Protein of Unknown function [Arenibacter palladensis]
MDELLLRIANSFFYVFHTVLIIFNLFGWILKRTRKLNLITLLLTFGSWVLLGIWKGWGYCFLTHWHYEILGRLGEHNLPNSYIAFLVKKITGWLPSAELINFYTLALAILALLCSLWANLKSGRRKRKPR